MNKSAFIVLILLFSFFQESHSQDVTKLKQTESLLEKIAELSDNEKTEMLSVYYQLNQLDENNPDYLRNICHYEFLTKNRPDSLIKYGEKWMKIYYNYKKQSYTPKNKNLTLQIYKSMCRTICDAYLDKQLYSKALPYAVRVYYCSDTDAKDLIGYSLCECYENTGDYEMAILILEEIIQYRLNLLKYTERDVLGKRVNDEFLSGYYLRLSNVYKIINADDYYWTVNLKKSAYCGNNTAVKLLNDMNIDF